MFDRLLAILEENLILIAVFILTITILLMIRDEPSLTDNEGFMYLATGIIITGLVNGIIQKNNDRQQRSSAETVQTLAAANASVTPVAAPAHQQPQAEAVIIEAETATVNTNEQPTRHHEAAGSPRPAWVDAAD